MPKCGTTDLWEKIIQHPFIGNQNVRNEKEPHWWTRKRLGECKESHNALWLLKRTLYLSAVSLGESGWGAPHGLEEMWGEV